MGHKCIYRVTYVVSESRSLINLSSDLLSLGETIRLEFFEDSLTQPALFTNDFDTPTEQFGAKTGLSMLFHRPYLAATRFGVGVDNPAQITPMQ